MPPLNLYARVRFFVHVCTRDRGCSAHPAFPAPSFLSRVAIDAKLGRIAPRDREAVSADTRCLKIESADIYRARMRHIPHVRAQGVTIMSACARILAAQTVEHGAGQTW